MTDRSKRLSAFLLVVSLTLLLTLPVNATDQEVVLYLFWREGCHYCEEEKPFLEELEKEYSRLRVEAREISSSQENVDLMTEMGKEYGEAIRAVPVTFLGNEVWVGFTVEIKKEIKEKVNYCLRNGCVNPMVKLRGEEAVKEDSTPSGATRKEKTIEVPFLGRVDLSSTSAFLSTAVISFVDGFNPCSLWVLTFLLGLLIYTQSRKKIILVGLTFLATTATAYSLFILGVFSAFQYIGKLLWIRVLVALVAFTFGVVNVKDYFWFKEGVSFTIPDTYKPKIAERARRVMQEGNSLLAMIGGTVVMALGVTLVELPCTAGFPVIWTGILNTQEVSGSLFAGLFLLYITIYLFDELLIFGTVTITLQSTKVQEKHGRVLKLVGGVLMLTLATSFLFAPELMNNILGSLVVFGVAIFLSLVTVIIRRKILPLLETK